MSAKVGLRSPAVVYSCVIKNNSDAEVDVLIEFAGTHDHHAEKADIQIAEGEEQRIDEKEFQHEDDPDSKYHKTVQSIHVRKFDGTTLDLKQPFSGVTSPSKDWVFEITNQEIKSVGSNKK